MRRKYAERIKAVQHVLRDSLWWPVVFVSRGRDFTFRYSGYRRLRFPYGTDLFRGDVLKNKTVVTLIRSLQKSNRSPGTDAVNCNLQDGCGLGLIP